MNQMRCDLTVCKNLTMQLVPPELGLTYWSRTERVRARSLPLRELNTNLGRAKRAKKSEIRNTKSEI